jgi:hypothetical protein
MELLGFALIQVMVAIITALLALERDRSGIVWFFLGVVFGVLALIVVLVAGKRNDADPPLRL